MKTLRSLLCGISLVAPLCSSAAELVFVVNQSNTDAIDRTGAANIFLGKTKTFPGGAKALPVGLDINQPELNTFFEKNLSKSTSQYRAYWSKMVFTGAAVPPPTVMTSEEVVEVVRRNRDAIGIADVTVAKGKVRILGDAVN